ncbi:MAG: hypothetical protein DDT19_00089 [Syntrophomonadaceae bacterium]|nr:hypothetical protein [Bacillota bacterium]
MILAIFAPIDGNRSEYRRAKKWIFCPYMGRMIPMCNCGYQNSDTTCLYYITQDEDGIYCRFPVEKEKEK